MSQLGAACRPVCFSLGMTLNYPSFSGKANHSYNHSHPVTGAFLFGFDFGFEKPVSILNPFRENGPGLRAGWMSRFDSGRCGTREVFEVELLLGLAATLSVLGTALFSALVLVGGGRNVG